MNLRDQDPWPWQLDVRQPHSGGRKPASEKLNALTPPSQLSCITPPHSLQRHLSRKGRQTMSQNAPCYSISEKKKLWQYILVIRARMWCLSLRTQARGGSLLPDEPRAQVSHCPHEQLPTSPWLHYFYSCINSWILPPLSLEVFTAPLPCGPLSSHWHQLNDCLSLGEAERSAATVAACVCCIATAGDIIEPNTPEETHHVAELTFQ